MGVEWTEQKEMFWRFVAERQAVYHRRFVKGQPFPWTDDEVLRENHFTNVYRELDRGTQWFHEHRTPFRISSGAAGGSTFRQLVMEVVAYRLINRIETFEAWHGATGTWLPGESDFGRFVEWIRARKGLEGKKVFTGRHLNVGVDGVEKALFHLAGLPPSWFDALKRARTGELAVKRLQQINGVGRFFSFQMYEDLCEAGCFDWHSGYAYLGPGAIEGMDIIFGKGQWTQGSFDSLVSHADEAFKTLGIDFDYWVRPDTGLPQRLRPKDIEHSLCEFSKYYRMAHGGKTSGRRSWPTE